MIRVLIFFVFCLNFSTSLQASVGEIHDHQHPNILVLHSYHRGLPWTDSLHEGLLAGLGEQTNHVNLFVEYLDALRSPLNSDSKTASFVGHIANRYVNTSVEILVATDDPAYNFLLAHRDRLWPGVPLLFAGVNNIRPENMSGLEHVAGVAESPDFPANLRVMQRLHPAIKRLVVIGDKTKTFVSNLEALEKANRELANPFDIEPIIHQKAADAIKSLREIKGEYLVFLMGRPLDDRGNFLTGPSNVEFFKKSMEKPIYSAWSFFMGNGIVGGNLVSGQDQGSELAGLIKRLINGQPFAQLPSLIESPNRYVFDFRELQRFNLSERALPAEALILNRPALLWEAYPKTFVASIALLLVLLVLIIVQGQLMRTKRRSADAVERELVLMQTLISAIPFPVFFKGKDLLFKRINLAFAQFIGKPSQQIIGQPISGIISKALAASFTNKDQELIEQGGQQIFEARFPEERGNDRIVMCHKALVQMPGGNVDGIVGVIVDITERHEQMSKLGLYAMMFEHTAAAVIVTDAQNKIIVTNPAMCRMSGYSLPELVGRNPRLLSSGKTPLPTYQAMWRALLDEGVWQGELEERRKDGTIYPKHVVISVVRNADGLIANYIATYVDITQQKQAEHNLRYLAMHDALTGLPNRGSLEAHLAKVCAQARRNDQHVALLFIDLDRFKMINDALGHPIGDAMLIEVGQRIQRALRESDFVARLGGDEFIAVLSDLDSGINATPAAQKILYSLSQPYRLQGNVLHSSPSIGVSIFPDDSDGVLELLKHSDIAMYAAKEKGRNNIQFFTPAMNQAAQSRMMLEHSLRGAISAKEFVLVYQPKVEAGSGRVVGAEALIRWTRPSGESIPPAVFIPLVEDMGLIGVLGAWVLEEACRQLALWNSGGGVQLIMAINLSAQQLHDDKLASFVAGLLETYGIPASQIELEITESTAMSDPQRAIEQLSRLRKVGVSLAIDDFGTGYSSLAYLKYLPIQTLKIDRSFVKNIETDESDAAISLATLALAHSLKLKVVAEGVETAGQAAYLNDHGCDLFQGYHYGKPESPENWPAHWLEGC